MKHHPLWRQQLNMKVFFNLALVCLIASTFAHESINISEDEVSQLKADLRECIIKENVSDEDAQRIDNWEVENPSAEMKCASACFFEKFGALKDNKVQYEFVAPKLTPIINEGRTNELLSACKDIKDGDRCDVGYQIFECMWNYRAF